MAVHTDGGSQSQQGDKRNELLLDHDNASGCSKRCMEMKRYPHTVLSKQTNYVQTDPLCYCFTART